MLEKGEGKKREEDTVRLADRCSAVVLLKQCLLNSDVHVNHPGSLTHHQCMLFVVVEVGIKGQNITWVLVTQFAEK